MDKKNLMPQAAQPVNRTTLGQLPPELAELSEEALSQLGGSAGVCIGIAGAAQIRGTAGYHLGQPQRDYGYHAPPHKYEYGCSYDGDDAE